MAPKALEKYEVIQILSMFKTTIVVLGVLENRKKTILKQSTSLTKKGIEYFIIKKLHYPQQVV